MRVAVFGAGAIGGFIAAALARAGNSVGVVARGAHLDAIRSAGSISVVSSDLGAFDAPVDAVADLRDLADAQFILVTFKSHQWAGVLPQFRDALARGATVVTLQNGMPFWYERSRAIESVDPAGSIRRNIPYEQIIGGVVHASGHVARPGTIHQSGGMLYPLGELDGMTTPRIVELSRAFTQAGLNAPIEPDIRVNIWRKLINNSALNPVSALARAGMKTMLHDPPMRELLRLMLEEGLAVARACGVDPGGDGEERLKWAGHLEDVKTSMLQDLEAGKPLELEPISGAMIEMARRCGVAVPHLETAYELARLLDSTNRRV